MDVRAWIELAESLGYKRTALLGHSFGARKVAWYQACSKDARVVGIIVASPVDRKLPPPDQKLLELTTRMVEEGRGRFRGRRLAAT